MKFSIAKPDANIISKLNEKINLKTKPLGSLGLLEAIALKIGTIQQTLNPTLVAPHIVVFAADHGIAQAGVSAYPQEVTYQMVQNFVNQGAAINVFSQQHNIQLKIVDAGVNHDFEGTMQIINAKVNHGTRNFLKEAAMTSEELEECFEHACTLVDNIQSSGCNIIGFGEMGIGNTSAAAVLMSLLLDLPIEDCVGRGTGLDNEQLQHKTNILQKAIDNHKNAIKTPMDVLKTFGGFEIAMICAGMLRAAEHGMVVLVDGFIASAAYLCARAIHSNMDDYAIYCHQSDEKGHRLLLEKLQAEPILKLGMRLGEGTGCAIAYPIIQSAIVFLNEMASFESAGVSKRG
ncbi:nicotinate-nucleotide--dimethylbenzimidazole phosphoribosyltransferase [Fulvivirgaceae bacterium BMA10]|uniref:Nicotinate-nucleotide--dimethylbenzimidazole phosphoribosyltransferase n=1 Tax=Splendidivirga corallicola TaxID=3051826 RepID=A0ABT8KVD5_9BACT|nr:nicotinate-nucleotide--dimethylbenzimidazole phosphoribosyltransferase [Fulvivirgaceae bacterium BMA10]